MKRSTRKFSKIVNRNTRKSNKKYIKKRRKYTQKGRGLGDVVKKFIVRQQNQQVKLHVVQRIEKI